MLLNVSHGMQPWIAALQAVQLKKVFIDRRQTNQLVRFIHFDIYFLPHESGPNATGKEHFVLPEKGVESGLRG